MAGGYAGHNEGGHIWGNNTKNWKGKAYTGPTSVCKAAVSYTHLDVYKRQV